MQNMLMPGPGAPAPAGGMPEGAPEGQPQGAPTLDPAQIADARAHMGVMMKGLLGLAAMPQGSLTKQAVFNAMGEMIANGAFSTPQSKQQLVAEMAQLPDDESAIRRTIGQHLLQMSQMREQFHQHFGAEG